MALGLYIPLLAAAAPARVAFVVDTSGSVPAAALAAVASELTAFLQQYPATTLHVLYVDASRLLSELAAAKADGRYSKLLAGLARIDLVVLDDWCLHPLTDAHRRDLLEILEDRYGRRSTVVTSQLPVAT